MASWSESNHTALHFWSLVTHPPSCLIPAFVSMPAIIESRIGNFAGDNFTRTYRLIRWRICWCTWEFSFGVWFVIRLIHVSPKVSTISFFLLVLSSTFLQCPTVSHAGSWTDKSGWRFTRRWPWTLPYSNRWRRICQNLENFVCLWWFPTRIPWFRIARPLRIYWGGKCYIGFRTCWLSELIFFKVSW